MSNVQSKTVNHQDDLSTTTVLQSVTVDPRDVKGEHPLIETPRVLTVDALMLSKDGDMETLLCSVWTWPPTIGGFGQMITGGNCRPLIGAPTSVLDTPGGA